MIFAFTTQGPGSISMTFELDGPLPTEIARKIPFAAMLAMNRTGDEAVRITRRKVAKRFIRRGLHSDQFFDASFTMVKFATTRDLSIEFGISQRLRQNASTVLNGAGGLARRAISLIDFETGEDRARPNTGNNNLLYVPAVGSSLRPTARDLLPKWAYPKALGLEDAPLNGGGVSQGRDRTPSRRGSIRGTRYRENRKAFILRDKQGAALGIFRRIPAGVQPLGGKFEKRRRGQKTNGPTVLELLFYMPTRVRIDARLGFLPDAATAMSERIDANFEGMLALALDQARMDRQKSMALADRKVYNNSSR